MPAEHRPAAAYDESGDPLTAIAGTLRSIEDVLARSDGLYTAYRAVAGERAAMITELIKDRDKLQAEVLRLQHRADSLDKKAQSAERRAAKSAQRISVLEERLSKVQQRRSRTQRRLREIREERDQLAARKSVRAALRFADAVTVLRPGGRNPGTDQR